MEFILPLAVSFAITVSLMPFFIGYFHYRQIGQTTREEGPLWHEVKTGTPTMGGTVFVIAILITLLFSAWIMNLLNIQVAMILASFLLFGGIGFIDDFISIFKKQNEGLTARQKFLTQLLFSALIVVLGIIGRVGLSLPLGFMTVTNGLIILAFGIMWITGFSNAVNLTDGLDGLATGLNIIAYSAYYYLAMRLNNLSVALACFIVIGSLFGFLFYNKKPAKIFMGDVGSLSLGAGLAVISLLLNNPWSLLILGIVFIIETVSVILQVFSYKTTGKRIFKMAPIHHHFEMSGWSESKVVFVFWLIGLIASILYFAIF